MYILFNNIFMKKQSLMMMLAGTRIGGVRSKAITPLTKMLIFDKLFFEQEASQNGLKSKELPYKVLFLSSTIF